MSDLDVLDVLNSMLETDRAFLQNLRFLSSGREELLSTQQRNTAAILAILRVYMTSNTTTYTIPITLPRGMGLPTGWDEPVVVRPTADQISAATTPIEISDCACAICQEEIDGSAMRIRHCQHTFHNTCIAEWFTRSVHCPNCRHDIRAVDHPAPTSADSVQTPPRARSRLAAWLGVGSPTLHTEDTEESDEHHA
jgi:hypothetical protein